MNLQSIIQPGEAVVYSTRGESYIEPFIALLGLMAGGSVLTAVVQPGGVWTILGIFILLVAAVTFLSRKEQPIHQAQIVISDRRLLFLPSKRDANVIDLPLSEITAINWSEDDTTGTLRITGESGLLVLPAMREPDALAAALAHAAGKRPPPPVGRMLNPDLLVPGSYLVTAGGMYMLLRWILSERWIATLSDITAWQGVAVEVFAFGTSLIAALALAAPVGRLAGVLLTVTLLKSCVTAEEMRTGLMSRNPDRWHRRAGAEMGRGSVWRGMEAVIEREQRCAIAATRPVYHVITAPEPRPPASPRPWSRASLRYGGRSIARLTGRRRR